MTDTVAPHPALDSPRPMPVSPPGGAEILAKAAEARAAQEAMLNDLVTLPLRHSDTLGKLAAALAKAQGQMTTASRDSKNPFFKSKYASLASVWDACRKALSENELAVIQPITVRGRAVIITTMLVHSSDEWIEERLTMLAAEDKAQAVGSTITYGRRYGLAAMVGVAPADDDDGEAATHQLPKGTSWDKSAGSRQLPVIPNTDELPEGTDLPEVLGMAAEGSTGSPSGHAREPELAGSTPRAAGTPSLPPSSVSGTVAPPARRRIAQPVGAAAPSTVAIAPPNASSSPPPPGRPPMRAPGT